ncbi:MAG TPA: hypothetical protein VHY20_09290, partial [Pirellulales bacterium]|nr:hypothetical protein [Pirellulales bacterium]
AHLQTPTARQWLLAPALGNRLPVAVRQAARAALATQAGALPGTTEAAAELYRAALQYDQQPPAMPPGAGGTATLWTWDAKRKLPVATQVPQRVASRELAARLAADGRDILPGEAALRRLQQTLLLEAAIDRAGGLARLDREPGGAVERVAGEGLEAVEDLLAFAADNHHPGPAAVAAEILGRRGSVELLTAEGGRPRPLTRAAAHADRRLRFAAVAAIVALDPRDPYPGSSLVADALKFFIGSRGLHTAVVGDLQTTGAQQVAGLLFPLGYEVQIATSTRELVKQAIGASDLELVLVDMVLANELSGKVVQDLRRDCRTANVPIGLLAATWQLNRGRILARREERTVAMLRPLDTSAAQTVVAAMRQLAAGEVSADERLAESRQALVWLAEESRHSHVELYPLVHFEDELVAALGSPALVHAALPLLGELGTPACQSALVELASTQAAVPAIRQAAAAAFGKNVTQHGILLSRAQIARQYDRYNASEGQDRQSQAVLATILDDMEAYAARQAGRGTTR